VPAASCAPLPVRPVSLSSKLASTKVTPHERALCSPPRGPGWSRHLGTRPATGAPPFPTAGWSPAPPPRGPSP
jgi:hypothetical protein